MPLACRSSPRCRAGTAGLRRPWPRLATRRLLGNQVVVPDVAAGLHRDLAAGAVHDQHVRDAVEPAQGLVDLRLQGEQRSAPPARVRRDHGRAVAVEDALAQRVRAEAAEHHRVRRADARASQHRDRGFGNHGQVDRHAITAADTQRLERVGAATNLVEQLAVGQRARVSRLAPGQRALVAAPCATWASRQTAAALMRPSTNQRRPVAAPTAPCSGPQATAAPARRDPKNSRDRRAIRGTCAGR